jgi:hypothetical protein
MRYDYLKSDSETVTMDSTDTISVFRGAAARPTGRPA